ncbi:MAG: hypothetical protein ACTH5W_18795 [Providencia sp.]|uniref:hypothetical protein n=1 Tax=Providencia sp. TaxID=589 RepID=UPI003F9B2281
MNNAIKIWLISQVWFWKLRAKLVKFKFITEKNWYKFHTYNFRALSNTRIFGSFVQISVKSLLLAIFTIFVLYNIENLIRDNTSLLPSMSKDDIKFNIDQLRLYAQLLTAIFSIYFATIGIILSTGYTKLRRDIIQLLTTEQIGSFYSKTLVFSAVFCLSATALHLFGFEPGILTYSAGTILTLIASLALFPLGQRLFNFFNLSQIVNSEILPRIARHIKSAANPKNTVSLAHYHSNAAKYAFEQLCYIDDRMRVDKINISDNLQTLSNSYTTLVLHYIHQKPQINYQSYWFPREQKHIQWFFAGDLATSTALEMSSQLKVEEEVNHQWFENIIIDRLSKHIEQAFQVGDFKLGINLINQFSLRIPTYAEQFQFEIGMQELLIIKKLIINTLDSPNLKKINNETTILVELADTWTALGSSFCLETLRHIIIFEDELKTFFDKDVWTERSIQSLPPFLQIELAFIVDYIRFECKTEGKRLSRPKYIQQLAIQKLLSKYEKILTQIGEFFEEVIPSFVNSLNKFNMKEAATQVILANLHTHWKLPNWFKTISLLLKRYEKYEHYSEEYYKLPKINLPDIIERVSIAHDKAIVMLSKPDIIEHIFTSKHNNKLPDHFGQIYFELAEACILSMKNNDEDKLSKIFPMFLVLSSTVAYSKFVDPTLEINDDFRQQLISSVIKDLTSVLGFAILYSAYFGNERLSEIVLDKFNEYTEKMPDKLQYLSSILYLSNLPYLKFIGSPRDRIRQSWKMSFEDKLRNDGFHDSFGISGGKPHSNKIIREFINSHADAYHLFFAMQVLPLLGQVEFKIDYQILSLSRRLNETHKEKENQK